MEVINPFNRVPEDEESLALGCRCTCSDGSAISDVGGLFDSERCGCQCSNGPMNDALNDEDALLG